ncbi:hypothetical protein ABIE67_007882 [Streptomyces sp. V4I8]|uniref:hypothetical protein n=1 Tax=Streptomyces sp. V4I8 TaxID=3156469 RepID=UPI00351798A4
MTTTDQPQGPEYTPCTQCSHIEPEHRPDAGPCLLCDCAAYRPAPAVPAGQAPATGRADVEPSDPTECSGDEGFCAEHGFHRHSLKQPGEPEPDTDRAGLRQLIAKALVRYDWNAGLSGRVTPSEHHYGEADAVLAVLPDRAALIRAHVTLAEQAGRDQAALARVRQLHDRLAEDTDLTSPNDPITRGAAAKRIAAALDSLTTPAPADRAAEVAELRRKLAAAERIRENADFHLGQEMARRQSAEKEAARLSADRAAVLTDAERTMLAYALDQAQERIWSEDGFTDEDQAAVTSLRRLAAAPRRRVCRAGAGGQRDARLRLPAPGRRAQRVRLRRRVRLRVDAQPEARRRGTAAEGGLNRDGPRTPARHPPPDPARLPGPHVRRRRHRRAGRRLHPHQPRRGDPQLRRRRLRSRHARAVPGSHLRRHPQDPRLQGRRVPPRSCGRGPVVIAEAIDTVLTLGWALAAWIVLTALAAALALHTVIAIAWWAGRAAWRACRRLYGRLPASTPLRAVREPQVTPGAPQAPSRPVPSWAHTDDHRTDQAA